MSDGNARPDRFDVAIAVVVTAGAALLVWLGQGLTFFWDEWEFITSRSLGDPATWFPPHNEHWSTLPILAYRALVETVGLGSYVPYHALLIGLHVAVVGGVYVLVRRTSGPWPATAAAVLILLFGSGFENLFWAFQIGFVAATGLCLAGLVVLDGPASRTRAGLLLVLLLAGLATSGVGLAMAVAIGAEVLLRPAWRRHAWILAVAAAVFAVWFFVIGRTGLGVQGDPFTVTSLLNVPLTVAEGFGSVVGGVTGLGPILGIVPAILFVAFALRRAARRTLPARTAACLLGILALYILVGLSRTAHPEGSGDAPRLTYFSGPLLIVGLAALVGRPTLPERPRERLVAVGLLGAWVAVSSIWNLPLLVAGRDVFAAHADITRALITLELDPPPGVAFDRSRPQFLVPSADALARIIARYGSPLMDALATVPPVSSEARRKAERYLFESGPIPVP